MRYKTTTTIIFCFCDNTVTPLNCENRNIKIFDKLTFIPTATRVFENKIFIISKSQILKY